MSDGSQFSPAVLMPTLELLSTELTQNYHKVIDATEALKNSAYFHSGAQQAHEAARAVVILRYVADPKSLGPNEASREAMIDGFTEDTKTALQDADRDLADSRHCLKMAELRLDAAKTRLRVYESIALLASTVEKG